MPKGVFEGEAGGLEKVACLKKIATGFEESDAETIAHTLLPAEAPLPIVEADPWGPSAPPAAALGIMHPLLMADVMSWEEADEAGNDEMESADGMHEHVKQSANHEGVKDHDAHG